MVRRNEPICEKASRKLCSRARASFFPNRINEEGKWSVNLLTVWKLGGRAFGSRTFIKPIHPDCGVNLIWPVKCGQSSNAETPDDAK